MVNPDSSDSPDSEPQDSWVSIPDPRHRGHSLPQPGQPHDSESHDSGSEDSWVSVSRVRRHSSPEHGQSQDSESKGFEPEDFDSQSVDAEDSKSQHSGVVISQRRPRSSQHPLGDLLNDDSWLPDEHDPPRYSSVPSTGLPSYIEDSERPVLPDLSDAHSLLRPAPLPLPGPWTPGTLPP